MFVLYTITGSILCAWLYLNFKVARMVTQKKLRGLKIYWWFFLQLLVVSGATAAFISLGRDTVMAHIILFFCSGMFIPASRDIVRNGQSVLDEPADNVW